MAIKKYHSVYERIQRYLCLLHRFERNPLICKRVRGSAAVRAMDGMACEIDTLTVSEPPRYVACEQEKSTAAAAVACIG